MPHAVSRRANGTLSHRQSTVRGNADEGTASQDHRTRRTRWLPGRFPGIARDRQVIEKWGGKVLVRAPVSSILIDEKNCAYGVVVKGKEILAKSVVSKHRGAEYVAMKNKWKGIFTKVLLDQFPQLDGKIDHTEFGTAVTNNYYLGTHRGAVYGLAHTPKRLEQHWLRPKTPIKNLFLSGQDAVCCGVTGALAGGYMCAYAMSGRAFLHTLSLWKK